MTDANDSTTEEPVRLTTLTSCGGCAAKWGAALLGELVDATRVGGDGSPADGLPDGLLVALSPSDDAAVVRISDDVALVSTTDFFPPLVDDPADFGAIAAANACSDVFAMGGDVLIALNIAAFPETLPTSAIRAIFRAAAEVVREAGGVVVGGHTIRSPEPIFGLAVQGTVRPGHEFVKGGARPGDVLMLSKPLGTGIALATGEENTIATAIAVMRSLNRAAADALRAQRPLVHAVTDVTGFGLMGHGWEIADRSGVQLFFEARALPVLEGVADAALRGVRTGGDARNRDYVAGHARIDTNAAHLETVAFDPQTSGGLLAAVDLAAVEALRASGFTAIGHVAEGAPTVTLR